MARNKKNINKQDVYKLLNNWLSDRRTDTEIPKEVLASYQINPSIILYYFMGSKYSIFISNTYNNWNLYSLNKKDILYTIKDIIQKTSYCPNYNKKFRDNKTELFKKLWDKYPYLKPNDINLLCTIVDKHEDKDIIYEMLGLTKLKKQKYTKKQIKEREKNNITF